MQITHRVPNKSIKEALQAKGISQVQAAFDLEINRVAFNYIANGWEIPGPVTRIKICHYLDLPERALFPEV